MGRGPTRRSSCAPIPMLAVAGTLAAALAGASPALAGPSPAHATPTGFSSSFEAGDPQPTWTDTVEIDRKGRPKQAGVTGPRRPGLPGDITETVVEVRASGENPPGEVKGNLIDGSAATKWLMFARAGWVELELSAPAAVVRYALTSANDELTRDPKDWTLSGSDDGETWTRLDERTGQEFPQRGHTTTLEVNNTTAYRHYRLEIATNNGAPFTQLAELRIADASPPPPPPETMTSAPGGGPRAPYNAKSGAGFTGLAALRYAGIHATEARGHAYNRVFDVNLRVTKDAELSYLIYPDFVKDDLSYPSTYAAVDLAFTDGTYLSDLDASDQHGATLSPQGQGRSKTLYADQWNFKRSRIGAVAAGKTIDRILVAYDNPDGPADFGGWIDDIEIDGDPPERRRSRPSDWVVTNRGTNSSSAFSRGNNVAATAVPNGFNLWIPVSHAGTPWFLNEYHRDNNAQNLPELEALSLSHEASPFMGDRQTFQVMPSAAPGAPPTGRTARALAFRHENEIVKPHRYGVEFENGIEAEIAPTDHAAMLRFTFPDEHANLVFDNVDANAAVAIDREAGALTGWSDVRSGLSNGATRMFVYATFDRPVAASETGPAQTGYAKFDLDRDRTVTMRIATSLISVDQARRNLALEIAPDETFADLTRRAQRQWDERLEIVEVEGASEDQLTTLYSNLYRLFLYPSSGHENVGTSRRPVYRHAVQSSTRTPPSTPTHTGAPVVDGKVYVNNGFWDTYRTAWPAYSLLAPRLAGELVDGFVQQYRDGGWVSRWSSPGYANLMTGTSSDVSFADAFVKGVPGIDARDTYDAALKNATVAPPGAVPYETAIGRKGLLESIFLGYTNRRVSEGVSWALEGYINDFGIANMAGAMARRAAPAQRERLREERDYFLSRARNYVNLFDPAIGFFQGREPNGRFKSTPEEYDPLEWGHDHDYTETNGWGFAFHVPHDGRGLANLYGGRDELADKLDEFFRIPETATRPGSYPIVTHEMVEARDARMGQWGVSNQVSHHIPYMYDYTGQPWKTQEKVREALRRLFVGSEIGQGYPGDDDTGEMSAWYLFGALGLYPLQVGSEDYAIGSPLFRKATVRLDNGRKIVVKAPRNSAENVYVQGLKVDGRRHDRTWLGHEQLADGAVLEFDMGPRPSGWAAGRHGVLRSVTDGDEAPRPLRDATGKDRGTATAAALFDDTSGTRATVADGRVEYRFREDTRHRIGFYTLTSSEAEADPSAWVLKGSNDGRSWKVLDERDGETFTWRSQTRPFRVDRPGSYSRYRIELADAPRLAEIELLTTQELWEPPYAVEAQGAVALPGDTVPVRVTVTNGDAAAGGEIAVTAPDGWRVEPATAAFGPLAPGESQSLAFDVTVPPGTARGVYPIEVAAASERGTVTAAAEIDVAPITVAAVRASGENAPFGEVKENLVDGSPQTKWLTFSGTGWAEVELSEPFAVKRYALTSANDSPTRDPKDWTLSGSDDGQTWTPLDRQTGQEFAERFETQEYALANTTAYRHYRLEITANQGENILQLAELQLFIDDRPARLPARP